MNPQAAKAGLGLALFVVILSVMILPLQTPGSAEFVVTMLSLLIGLVATGVIAFVIRRMSR
jgi:preprotein translocase subunit Sss1